MQLGVASAARVAHWRGQVGRLGSALELTQLALYCRDQRVRAIRKKWNTRGIDALRINASILENKSVCSNT